MSMWKKQAATISGGGGLPGSPSLDPGFYVEKRLEESGPMGAVVWEHEKLITLMVTAQYEKKKGVLVGNLAFAGDPECRAAQINALIDLLQKI